MEFMKWQLTNTEKKNYIMQVFLTEQKHDDIYHICNPEIVIIYIHERLRT